MAGSCSLNLDLLEQELGEHGYAIDWATTGREALKKIEEVITRALHETRGNRAVAARALGLHKTHLLKLMKSLGID